MITNAILFIFFTFLGAVTSLLPSYSGLPDDLETAFNSIGTYLNQANVIFPIDTLFDCAVILVSVEFAIMTFKLLNFVINKVRGSG